MPAAAGVLEWTLDWGPAAVAGVMLLALVVMALAFVSSAALPPRRRGAVRALRAAAVLLLVIVMLQPTWVEVRARPDERVVAVLVDGSRSMAPGGAPTRWREALAESDALAGRVAVERFAVSGAALGPLPLPTPAGGLGDGERTDAGSTAARPRAHHRSRLRGGVAATAPGPDGGETDLIASLRAFAENARPPGLTSVVLISDGRDHGALRYGAASELDDALLALGVPVHTVQIGDDAPLRDVVISDVRASSHALVRSPLPIEIDVDVGAYASEAGRVEVLVELDGESVASVGIELPGPALRRVRTSMTPTTTGAHVLSVRAVPLPGELTEANNRVHLPIDVLRDRTRVMHLAGHPSLDTRFLRAHLKADDNVDLISYYIMVGRDAGLFIDAEDTTLIAFPTETLFGEALDDFDLVIFHDFAFVTYGIERFLDARVLPWLRRGGAFLVVGGRQSFAAGAWEQTSIGPLLPVGIGAGDGDDGWREALVAPRLTDLGAAHPVTQLRDGVDASIDAWMLSRLPGHNTRLVARSGDAVLVEADDGSPLLAVGERGLGRVAAIASDGLWTWAFPHLDARSHADARADYRRLLTSLRGWLLRDPAYASITLEIPTAAVAPGADVVVEVTARGLDQRPLANHPIVLVDSPLPRTRGEGRTITATTDAQGHATLRFGAGSNGPHQVRVSSGADGDERSAVGAYAVAEGVAEDLDLRPDPASLGRIAAAAGGVAVHDAADLDTGALLGPRAQRQELVRHTLWAHPAVLALLLALLIAEWALRRRWGLR